MAQSRQILDISPLGMQFTILKTAAETAGKSLDLHWDLLPGCNMKNPLLHIHPYAKETYDILEGEMEFYVKDKWIRAVKGDHLEVPAGITHSFRNPGNNIVNVFNTHQPAFRMEQYFEDVVKVVDKITRNRTVHLRMNLRAKLYLGVLMNRYRQEIIAKSPPDLAVRILGGIGKVMGMKY